MRNALIKSPSIFMAGFLLFIFGGLCGSTFAADRYYQIEVVAFSQIKKSEILSERWPDAMAFSIPDNAIEVTPYRKIRDVFSGSDGQFRPTVMGVSSDQFKLNSTLANLKRSSRYKVIYHKAWQQGFNFNKPAKVFYLFGGRDYGAEDSPLWQLEGTLSIQLQYELKVAANMDYRFAIPASWLGEKDIDDSSNLKQFPIQQVMSTPSNKLIYFDNPAWGMFVKIIPVKAIL